MDVRTPGLPGFIPYLALSTGKRVGGRPALPRFVLLRFLTALGIAIFRTHSVPRAFCVVLLDSSKQNKICFAQTLIFVNFLYCLSSRSSSARWSNLRENWLLMKVEVLCEKCLWLQLYGSYAGVGVMYVNARKSFVVFVRTGCCTPMPFEVQYWQQGSSRCTWMIMNSIAR